MAARVARRRRRPPVTLGPLARAFAVFVAVPELCSRLLRRAFEGRAHVARGSLVVVRNGRRIECLRVDRESARVAAAACRLPVSRSGSRPAPRCPSGSPSRIGAAAGVAREAGVAAARAACRVRRFAMRLRGRLARALVERATCKVALALLPAAVGFYAPSTSPSAPARRVLPAGLGAWLRTGASTCSPRCSTWRCGRRSSALRRRRCCSRGRGSRPSARAARAASRNAPPRRSSISACRPCWRRASWLRARQG